MSALAWLRKHLDGEGGNDVIREIVKVFAKEPLSAEAEAPAERAGASAAPSDELPQRLPQASWRSIGG
jgi:hypothetical protein